MFVCVVLRLLFIYATQDDGEWVSEDESNEDV